MYVVYTQILAANGIDRWYYGTYETRDRANEVAYELGNDGTTSHSICAVEDAKAYGIMNLPYALNK